MYKKVLSKAPNGTTYIYMDEPYYDKGTGKSSHRRVCVGKVGEDGNELYNSRYSSFLGDNTSAEVTRAVPIGEKLLLDKVIRGLGLERILTEAIGKERTTLSLSLASYLTAGGKELSEAPYWLNEHGYEAMTKEEVYSLLETLRPFEVSRFHSLWTGRKGTGRSYLYLLHPIVSYGTAGTYLERGLKDEESPPLSLAALFSRRYPLSVSEYQGKDAEDLEVLLSGPEFETAEDITVVGDRSLYSLGAQLSARGLSYILPVPPGVRSQYDTLRQNRERLYASSSILVDKDNEVIHSVTMEEKGRNGKIYRHLYYDEVRKERENRAFLERLERCRQGKAGRNDARFMRRYLGNPEAVDEFLNGPSSCWMLISDSEPRAREALCQYRTRNDTELRFDDLRNSTDSGRTGMDEMIDGKLFLHFLSLILVSELKNKVSSTGLRRKYHYNWKDILARMSSYSKVSVGKLDLYTAPSEEQRRIIDAFKL